MCQFDLNQQKYVTSISSMMESQCILWNPDLELIQVKPPADVTDFEGS